MEQERVPIEFRVDHAQRMVIAHGRGVITHDDVFAYQRDAWSRPEVLGYDELLDLTSAEGLETPQAERIRELAHLATAMDTSGAPSRFAIVASEALTFGVARMYEAFRALAPGSKKEVGVFRTTPEALAFLRAGDSGGTPRLTP